MPDDITPGHAAPDPGTAAADTGGDAVCWLHRLCPECGAMPSGDAGEGEPPPRCWRCGAPAAGSEGDRGWAGT